MRSFLKEGPGLAGIAADFVLEGLQTGETALAPEEMPQLQGDGLAVQVAGIVQKPGLNGEAMAVYGGAGSDVGDGQIRSLRSACPAGIDALGGRRSSGGSSKLAVGMPQVRPRWAPDTTVPVNWWGCPKNRRARSRSPASRRERM